MPPILTCVGSFPRLADAAEEAILQALELQRRYGIGLFTDGEQRGDMLSMYDSLPGIHSEGGMPRFVGRVLPLEDPADFVKIRDLDFLRSKFPELRFKVSLTGPTTFAFSCGSTGAGPAYRGATDPALHDDLTEAIRPLAREVARRGAEVQLDDPILSQGMRDYGPVLARVDRIGAEVPRDRMSLHVCGGLARGKVLEALFRLENVSTLNLAFAGASERGNVELLDSGAWNDRGLYLGAGSIPVQVTAPEEIPSPDGVAALIQSIAGRVGADRLRYVLPDCGLRATAADLIPRILGNLREGFDRALRADA